MVQRMVEIARALATGPSILLLTNQPRRQPQRDRPVVDVIRALPASGVTMLVIEHHMDLSWACQSRAVLDYGRRSPRARRQRQANQRVIEAYLGSAEHSSTTNARVGGGAGMNDKPLLSVNDLVVRYGQIEALHGCFARVFPAR